MALPDIFTVKELSEGFQPLLIVDFTFADDEHLRVSTHPLNAAEGGAPPSIPGAPFDGQEFLARIVDQSVPFTQALSEAGIDITPSLDLGLSNGDMFVSNNFENNTGRGFRGASVKAYLLFHDPLTDEFSTDYLLIFDGIAEAPTEISDRVLRVTANAKTNLNKVILPKTRIQVRCPLLFPETVEERTAGLNEPLSRFHPCGYSPDIVNGLGNLGPGGIPFDHCNFTVEHCKERGMYNGDTSSNPTGSFPGITFAPPPTTLERNFRSKPETLRQSRNLSILGALFPVVYGESWLRSAPVANVVRGGQLTGFEVIAMFGEPESLLRVEVNGVRIEEGTLGSPVAGFWNEINNGDRHGFPNVMPPWNGRGNPYGNIKAIAIMVPRALHDSEAPPTVDLFLKGKKVRIYSDVSTFTLAYSKNPVWILLDVKLESGFSPSDLDLQAIIDAAAFADEPVTFEDPDAPATEHPRYQASVTLDSRTTASELIRGLRVNCDAVIAPSSNGKIGIFINSTLAKQQPGPVPGSNDVQPYASLLPDGTATDGFVAYSFDRSNIVMDDSNRLSFNLRWRRINDTPTTLSFTFLNQYRQFQEDSIRMRDREAIERIGRETEQTLPVEGIMNYDQAKRIAARQLAFNTRGNARGDAGGTAIAEFTTSVNAAHLRIGQIIRIDVPEFELDDGLQSPPGTPRDGAFFRITAIKGSTNMETFDIRAEFHKDTWWRDAFGQDGDPGEENIRRDSENRPSFPWQPDFEIPALNDDIHSQSERFFGLKQRYITLADNTAQGFLDIKGRLPINEFSDVVRPPNVPLEGTSAPTGGTIPGGKTYFFRIVSKETAGANSLLSGPSKDIDVSVPAGTDTNTVSLIDLVWPTEPVPPGYVVFGGSSPNLLTFQVEVDGALPSSIQLTSLNDRRWGVPDVEFDRLIVRGKRVAHSGVFGNAVSAVTSTSITVANAQWSVNEWAGRYCAFLGQLGSFGDLPVAHFRVASNTDQVLTLDTGQPDPQALGFGPGDVLVMRMQPTVSQDGKTITDPLWDNSLGLEGPKTLDQATNATPIVATVTAHGYSTGDRVRIDNAVGNTAANGVHTITVLTSDTFQLQGSSGNGTYVAGSGIARRLTGGLEPGAEVGLVARIICGTGQGQVRRIAANTALSHTVDRTWDTLPADDSIIVIEEPNWDVEVSTTPTDNSDRTAETTVSLPVSNFLNQVMLVMPFTADGGDNESWEHLNQARDIFVFGDPGDIAGQIASADDVTNVTIAENPEIDDAGQITSRVSGTFIKPSPLGTYAGVEIWVRDLDAQSQPISDWGSVKRFDAETYAFNRDRLFDDQIIELEFRSFNTANVVNVSGPRITVALDLQVDGIQAPNVTNVVQTFFAPPTFSRGASFGQSETSLRASWTLPTADPNFTRLADLVISLRRVLGGAEEQLAVLAVNHAGQTPTNFDVARPQPNPGGQFVIVVRSRNAQGTLTSNPPISNQFALGEAAAVPAVTNFSAVVVPTTIDGESKFFIDTSWTLPSGGDGDFIDAVQIFKEQPPGSNQQSMAIEKDGSTSVRSGPFNHPPGGETAKVFARSVLIDRRTNEGSEPSVVVNIPALATPTPLTEQNFQAFVEQGNESDLGVRTYRFRFEWPVQTDLDLREIRIRGRESGPNAFPFAVRNAFDDPFWGKTGLGPIEVDVEAAPFGALLADGIVEDASVDQHMVTRNLDGLPANTNIVNWIAVRRRRDIEGARHFGMRYVNKAGMEARLGVNLTTGAVVTSGSILAEAWAQKPSGWLVVGGKPWWLLVLIANSGAGTVQEQITYNIIQTAGLTAEVYQGNGLSSLAFSMAGVQAEEEAFLDPTRRKRFATEGRNSTGVTTDSWPLKSSGFISVIEAQLVNKFGEVNPNSPERITLVNTDTVGLDGGLMRSATLEALEVVDVGGVQKLRPKAGDGLAIQAGALTPVVGNGLSTVNGVVQPNLGGGMKLVGGTSIEPNINQSTFEISGGAIAVRVNGLNDVHLANISGGKVISGTTFVGVNFQQIALPNTLDITGSGLSQLNQTSGDSISLASGEINVSNSSTGNSVKVTQGFILGVGSFGRFNLAGTALSLQTIAQVERVRLTNTGIGEYKNSSGTNRIVIRTNGQDRGEIERNQGTGFAVWSALQNIQIAQGSITTSAQNFSIQTGLASILVIIPKIRNSTADVTHVSSTGGQANLSKVNAFSETVDWFAVGTI